MLAAAQRCVTHGGRDGLSHSLRVWVRVDHHFLFSVSRAGTGGGGNAWHPSSASGKCGTLARVPVCVCVCAAMCVTFIFAISHLTTPRPRTHTHPISTSTVKFSERCPAACPPPPAQDINIFYHKRILWQRAKNNNNDGSSSSRNNK